MGEQWVMMPSEAVHFLQSISITAVHLQALVEQMDLKEVSGLFRQIDRDLDGLLDYLKENN